MATFPMLFGMAGAVAAVPPAQVQRVTPALDRLLDEAQVAADRGDPGGAATLAARAVALVDGERPPLPERQYRALAALTHYQTETDRDALLATIARQVAAAEAAFGAQDFRTLAVQCDQADWRSLLEPGSRDMTRMIALTDRIGPIARSDAERDQ